ncbi:MAG: glycosyltransferase [Actinomycetota bacterium]
MSDDDPPDPQPVLPDDARRALDRIDAADLVVGIPTLDNAATIDGVITAVEVGLRKLFPDMRAVICVSDGGSEDGSRSVAAAAGVGDRAERFLVPPSTRAPEVIVFRYGGIPGKGSALRGVFECVRALGAGACAVLDADLRSITPYWIDRLLTPVVHHGFEFVAPLYVRHRHDGTITNSVAHPLTAALYGSRIRQPIGGEFAMSGDVALHFDEADVWETDVARFGIDLWMTTVSLVEGRRVCQSILGAKLHDPKDPGRSLGPMFREVVGTCFALAERYADRWRGVDEVTTSPTFGFSSAVVPEPVIVSVARLRQRFEEGRERWEPTWRRLLSPELLDRAVAGDLDAETWIGVVYDELAAWAAGEDHAEVLGSLLPLYFAWTARFAERTAHVAEREVDAEVQLLVDAAVRQKPRLLSRWPAHAAAG